MRRLTLASALLASVLGSAAFAVENNSEAAQQAKAAAANTGVEKIVFTNKLIDGKKVWTPGESKTHTGVKVELTLVNELNEPHGFSAREFGLKEDIVVGPLETKTIVVDAPKSGSYKVSCHMHPAHVGATVTVQ